MGSFLKDMKKAVDKGKKVKKSLAKVEPKKVKSEEVAFLTSTIIVGSKHLEDKEPLEKLGDGDSVFFAFEPDNEFDKNAIVVVNSKKQRLGYIPKGDQKEINKVMGVKYKAEIDDVEDLSVWIDCDC